MSIGSLKLQSGTPVVQQGLLITGRAIRQKMTNCHFSQGFGRRAPVVLSVVGPDIGVCLPVLPYLTIPVILHRFPFLRPCDRMAGTLPAPALEAASCPLRQECFFVNRTLGLHFSSPWLRKRPPRSSRGKASHRSKNSHPVGYVQHTLALPLRLPKSSAKLELVSGARSFCIHNIISWLDLFKYIHRHRNPCRHFLCTEILF